MKNKPLILAVGIGLIVAVIVLTSLISNRGDGSRDLFQQSLNGETEATCMLTNTEHLSSGASEVTYYISSDNMRIVEKFDDSGLDDGGEWNSYTLLTDGFVYSWSTLSSSGIVNSFAGSPKTYLEGEDIASESRDRSRQYLKDAGAKCEPGIQTNGAFVKPENISFVEESDGATPSDEL